MSMNICNNRILIIGLIIIIIGLIIIKIYKYNNNIIIKTILIIQ